MKNYNRMKKATREAGRFIAVSMLAAACVALPVHAVPDEPAPVLQPGVPMKYVVKKGDTLWDIAGYFLRDPWLWPEIWFINNEVENPHLIYPGDILYLVWRDGKPRVERSNVVKLSPEIRTTVIDTPIPTIPLDIIKGFLKGETKALFYNMYFLSKFLLENLTPMIPSLVRDLWKTGLDTGAYYLKLCGSGGGGYVLGFTEDLEKAKKYLKDYQIQVIKRF